MVSVGGAQAKIVFRRRGYTPHFAEYVDDPVTGDEVMVMADPHSRRAAYIYNPEKKQIIWEYRVPGSRITANPHIARLVVEEMPAFKARPGDVLCADLDNRFIVVDRETKQVKWSFSPPDAKWSHDLFPSKDFQHMLTTDYGTGVLRKIDEKGDEVWSLKLGAGLAKLSRIAGKVPSGVHGNSFGGDILAAVNQSIRGVYEISEDDGLVKWSCPPNGSKNVFLTLKPHAAVRVGLAELGGNLTVFNHEAGGGVVAVDHDCRPRWGVMKPFTSGEGREIYRPSSTGLFETTHVFTTSHAFIGLIDWDGPDYSTVYELDGPPRSALYWMLAWRREGVNGEEFLDPPLETSEWSENVLQAVNHGPGRLKIKVYGTYSSFVKTDDSSIWVEASSLSVEPHGFGEVKVSGYAAVRVAVSSESKTNYTVYVVNKP